MIMITMSQIKKNDPCKAGWKQLKKSKGFKIADYDTPFPLSDVRESNGLNDCLWCLRCVPEHNNLWRKYTVWCARQVQHLMTDQRSLDALDVAWRHSDGLATDAELQAARAAAWAAAGVAAGVAAWAATGAAAEAAARDAAWAAQDAACAAAGVAAWAATRAATRAAAGVEMRELQSTKLRQILDAGKWVE